MRCFRLSTSGETKLILEFPKILTHHFDKPVKKGMEKIKRFLCIILEGLGVPYKSKLLCLRSQYFCHRFFGFQHIVDQGKNIKDINGLVSDFVHWDIHHWEIFTRWVTILKEEPPGPMIPALMDVKGVARLLSFHLIARQR